METSVFINVSDMDGNVLSGAVSSPSQLEATAVSRKALVQTEWPLWGPHRSLVRLLWETILPQMKNCSVSMRRAIISSRHSAQNVALFGSYVRGLSGKYPSIINILRTDRLALMYLGSQSEEILLCIHEQSISSVANQSAVRRRWLNLCSVWPSHSQWPNEEIHYDNAPAHSKTLVQTHITQVCQPPYKPDFTPCDVRHFKKLKSPLKGGGEISGPVSPCYGGFTITLRYTTLGRTPLDEWWSQCEDLFLTTHNRWISMSPAGFDPTIPAF